jgi:GTP cyclohydrolase I
MNYINDDPSPFADANFELEYTKFSSVEGLAEFLLMHVAGLDPGDPQERDTPARFVKALRELTTGERFDFTVFESDIDEMVVVRDVEFSTLCRHHVLPFMGKAHLAYVPNGKIVGLSKIPRLIRSHCARLNTQEELTEHIAEGFNHLVEPLGVGVIMEATHTCMSIRGARSNGSTTRTAAMRGVFADHSRTAKAEFLEAIR